MVTPIDGERESLVGRRLADRYVVERLLARGGMAHVYRAIDERLDRPVAVKVLAAPFTDDPSYVSRFLDEARIAAGLAHPNLAHVYDSGSDGQLRFIVLELLEGYTSLRDVLEQRGRLPAEDAVRIVRDVLAGLGPLHAAGLVHCDVKPGNVLIGPAGTKLIDFGIARPLNQPNVGPTSIGSLHSMSPEQLRGDGLTPASDIFAVGVVLYQALTGHVPFAGETPSAVAAAHDAGRPAAPSEAAPELPELLDAAVLEALEVDPTRRFASTSAMDVALEAGMQAAAAPQDETTTVVTLDSPRAAEPQVAAAPPVVGKPRRPVTLVALLLAAAASLVVAAALLFGGPEAPPPAAEAADATATPEASRSVPAGRVEVPDTIGMTEAEAEDAARQAGLNWRIEWRVDPAQEPGIYDQQPAAGRLVEPGSRFVMQAYRER